MAMHGAVGVAHVSTVLCCDVAMHGFIEVAHISIVLCCDVAMQGGMLSFRCDGAVMW